MATEPRRRTARAPQTPQNSTKLGLILVVAAVLVGVLIFSVGGGKGDDTSPGTAGDQAQDGVTTTTEPVIEAPTTQPIAALNLVAANGSGVSGRAGATRDRFVSAGYSATTAVDGTRTEATTIYYAVGFDADALGVATAMGLTPDRVAAMPEPQPLNTPAPGAQVVVLIGPDFDPATAAWATGATN